MSSIKQLIEDSVGAYLVSKKIAKHELHETKTSITSQVEQVIVKAIKLILLCITIFMFMLYGSLTVGKALQESTNFGAWIYLAPTILFGLITIALIIDRKLR